jgi:hypothetical protein
MPISSIANQSLDNIPQTLLAVPDYSPAILHGAFFSLREKGVAGDEVKKKNRMDLSLKLLLTQKTSSLTMWQS